MCAHCQKEFHRKKKGLYCSRSCAGHYKHPYSVPERFWPKVNKTETCWLWTGARYGTGYGSFFIDRKRFSAHRVSYELLVRPIPSGMQCLHHCDTPLCVRPSHLFLGNAKDNMRDALDKGRFQVGERHYKAKLTEKDVSYIRDRRDISQGVLARRFGVTQSTVGNARNRKTWTHI